MKLSASIQLISVKNSYCFQVIQDNYYRSNIVGIVKIERGLITDLASVPWFARWIYSRSGKHKDAAIIHDAMLSQHRRYTRKQADQVFKEALQDIKLNKLSICILYLAVRLNAFFWGEK